MNSVRSFRAAFRLPCRDRLMCLEIDSECAVFIFEIGVEAMPLRVDGESFGVSVERQLSFLNERLRVEDADRLVARRRDIRHTIWRRIELAACNFGHRDGVVRAD